MRHHRISLIALFVLTCLVALPLSASDTPDLNTSALTDLEPVPVLFGEACFVESSLDAQVAVAPTVDGVQVAARLCRENACDRYCKAVFGPFAGGFCEDGTCQCAV